VRNAVAAGVTEVFLIGAGLIGIAFLAAFFLREIPLRTTRHSMADELGMEFGAGVGPELADELTAAAAAGRN
jgi:hypothetical protein